MFVEISNPDNPKSTFTVGNFYRPPHIAVAQLTSCIDYFAEKLAHFNTREKFYICGDFNINLLSLSSNEHVRNYFEGILSSGFLPTITLPTRLSVNSTLIDNIFLNKQEHLNFAGILDCEISDRQMTLINANLMPPTEKNKYVTIYSHNDESISKFRNDIIDKRIFNRLNKDLHSNLNANYDLLESEIVHSMNSHLGIKIVKFNKKKHKRDPWITYGILKSVNQKNLQFKRMKKANVVSPLYDDRNNSSTVIKISFVDLSIKQRRYTIEQNLIDTVVMGKKTWRTLDNALHRKTKRTTPDAMLIKEEICTVKTDIADAFNDYFATISSNNHVQPNDTPSYKNYLNAPTDTSFSFQPIDNTVTLQLLSKLTATHSCGHDNIHVSSTVLKYISNEISECITLIVNQSIMTGIYPDKLKVAKVVPIFKKENKLQLKNYRPISVLPVISKIF